MPTYLPQRLFSSGKYSILLLNLKVKLDDTFFLRVWNNAAIRHAVDGGANQFFQFLDRQPEEIRNTVKYPDISSGDFDSISDDSMSRLKNTNLSKCKIVHTEDQEETDFTKALCVLKGELTQQGKLNEVKTVIAICEYSGRLDQIIANLNTLHKNVFVEPSTNDQPTVFLMSSENLAWLLPAKQDSTISFENDVPDFTCGVIPLQGPTKYTSSGLKWDLTTDLVCHFGGMISTSNKVVKKKMHITPVDNHSIFTLELATKDYIL